LRGSWRAIAVSGEQAKKEGREVNAAQEWRNQEEVYEEFY